MVLPALTIDGLLPPGDHTLTISELRQSYLVTGEGIDVPGWDTTWRAQLVDNLELFVEQLWQVGVESIFVNGSFASSKPDPQDIDAYFECDAWSYAQILIQLLQLEPPLPWDLTHRPWSAATRSPKPVMWHRYRVELFPHFADYPAPTGIKDEYGNDLLFPALFRRDRVIGRQKGVIRLICE